MDAEARLPVVDELLASRARLVASADDERRALERNLHDGVQQQLVGLAVELQLAQRRHGGDSALAASLEGVRRGLLQAIDDLRRFAHLLYPSLLDDGGLGAALRAAAAQAGVPARIEVPAGRTVTRDAALAVYLCCTRALEASACESLSVVLEDGVVRLEVVLDGADAATATVAPHQDRFEALAGSLAADGERVLGTLPVPA